MIYYSEAELLAVEFGEGISNVTACGFKEVKERQCEEERPSQESTNDVIITTQTHACLAVKRSPW
jgi:hypothetical protein